MTTPDPTVLLSAALVLISCGTPTDSTERDSQDTTTPVEDVAGPDGASTDAAGPDGASTDTGIAPPDTNDAAAEEPDAPPDPPGDPPPGQYCELAADVFCGFYVRCGRMAVADVAECLPTFVEACNARFEPVYVALADQGLLTLSQVGLAGCKDHLDAVACDAQVFDLDGPCSWIWLGQQTAGGACGPGIESFVCDADTTCVLGLNFCGACKPAQPTGSPCGDGKRCHAGDVCFEGNCTARIAAGVSCHAEVPCILGASCADDGICRGDTWVSVGALCDADHRCPYKSVCSGGVCVETVLQGAACSSSGACASGWCQAGQCAAYGAPGDACEDTVQCGPGGCEQGICTPPNLSCL